ncbi:hypothetical protein V5N11_007891 [Cardamine amara subsp. amara]|uniref:Protein kinase C-terminal domain-containing protein n=1 Tax=Cardamine amara subsp. amara TaxID=228776 RepID=A0ABD1BQ73_CARAN
MITRLGSVPGIDINRFCKSSLQGFGSKLFKFLFIKFKTKMINNDDLDTQNFEKFDESESQTQTSSKSGPWRKMLSSKDINFVGYTYKNFEIVNDYQVPGMAELKKKKKSTARPMVKSLFDSGSSETSDSSETTSRPPCERPPPTPLIVQGSFLKLLPPELEVRPKQEESEAC